MSAATARRLGLTRAKEPPEDSIGLRLIVGALVMIAVIAVIAQGALDTPTAVGALVVVPAGYAFSHGRRRHANVVVKVCLAVGLVLALGAFLQRVRFAETVDEARQPLAALFIWVQALHAFDVPRRRDLAFSVVSSVILIAEAASLSFDTGFALLLVPWVVLAAAWLYATQRPVRLGLDSPRFVRRVTPPSHGRRFAVARAASAGAAVVLVAVVATFAAMPRLPGTYVRLPPFSLAHAVPVPSFDGAVSNPSMPGAGSDGIVDFSGAAYPGFGDRVDLRGRGHLSDRLVMLVRSPEAALWRGEVYDTFDGTTWTESEPATTMIGQDAEQSFALAGASASEGGARAPGHRLVATFYLQERQPNIVFTAYAPERVFFPTAQLALGPGASLRSPILLDRGLVYSVVSRVPDVGAATLRTQAGPVDRSALAPYLQLPGDLPERVVALAERVTEGAETEYDAVAAVQRWLRSHTAYDVDVPRDPPGADAVDQFLFERRRGFCEHIASAMAILLRSVGVPTRLVTGFGPGERNVLTGYFEIREADAHAWVEVMYPGVGWVPYDPTFGVPPANPGTAWFAAPAILRSFGRWASRAVPAPIRDAATATAGALAAGARAGFAAWPALVGVLVAVVLVPWSVRRRRRARDPLPRGAAAGFDRMSRALAARGSPRRASQTPSEYLGALRATARRGGLTPEIVSDAERIVRAFERERFASEPLDDADVDEAIAAAERIARTLRASPR